MNLLVMSQILNLLLLKGENQMAIKIDTYFDITCENCARSWSTDFDGNKMSTITGAGGMGMATDKQWLKKLPTLLAGSVRVAELFALSAQKALTSQNAPSTALISLNVKKNMTMNLWDIVVVRLIWLLGQEYSSVQSMRYETMKLIACSMHKKTLLWGLLFNFYLTYTTVCRIILIEKTKMRQ
jgi:hypothetical protein